MARNRQRAKDRKQKLHRENVPGQLDHASGEVDQVEAAIVAGAAASAEPAVGEPLGEDYDDAGPDASLDEEQLGAGDVAAGAAGRVKREASGSKVVNFARGCIAELDRVQWPDRRATGQATAVVFGFVVIAGAFLGLADTVAQKIIDLIL